MAHIAWQQRVDKERKTLAKHICASIKKNGGILPGQDHDGNFGDPYGDDIAALHDLHRTASSPALLPPSSRGAGYSNSGGFLPKIDGRMGTGASRPGTHSTALSAVTRSRRSSSHRDQLTSSSQRSHSCSNITGLTTASLRREVADAVAMEVAKVVQPLKDKLQTEESTRQRLEDMLRKARGDQSM
eukprot:TRINITY_DN18211_c0_g1_i1.p1 TRINITY_DN18211_c0_g1~~TRINITY_DN18211_c0_g1_i1.p1  ORF type:complete len:186 (-),score=33.61 TRINITY_DN18211_c0_g1_i1:89-646(-)